MSEAPRRRGGLFLRIALSFMGGVLLFVIATAVVLLIVQRTYGTAYVDKVVTRIEASNDEAAELIKAQTPPRKLNQRLSKELDTHVIVMPRPQFLPRRRRREPPGMGVPTPRSLGLSRAEVKRLKRGIPVVRSGLFPPPKIIWRITDPEDGTLMAYVLAERPKRLPIPIALSLILLLLSVAAMAWPLARSLTRRLRELEHSTAAFAAGDLDARARVDERGDEVDYLAESFNDMAAQLAKLILGQRTLLANVSHELRTPLARMRVLLEILNDKAELMEQDHQGEDLQRVSRGLGELETDVREMETLVRDLLTSGRLELGKNLQRRPFDLAELCELAAAKVAARYESSLSGEAATAVEFEGDQLLLERLLSNLLANARRACPEGEILVSLDSRDDSFCVVVQDEGPGVPEARRAEIFEAFTRLDSARARDDGGVGLGLYLSRQIAQAHGGELQVMSRPDGASGARFELTLPRRAGQDVALPQSAGA